MKIIISSLIFILLVVFSSYSQNWAPAKSGLQSNFSCDTTNVIFSISVDSINANSGDTIYYLNRVVLPCDTCSVAYIDYILQTGPAPWDPPLTNMFFLQNQPLFLQREIIFNSTQKKYSLLSDSRIAILPENSLGNSWLFDTLQNISANITEKSLITVLGLPDSLETIILSTGDSIVLSKTYGIVKYPTGYGTGDYFRLIGLEKNVSAGLQLPDFYDYFNYNVGDEFGYTFSGGNPAYYFYGDDFFTIEQKNYIGNEILYIIGGGNMNSYYENWMTGDIITYNGQAGGGLNYSDDSVNPNYTISDVEGVGFRLNIFDKKSYEIIQNDYSIDYHGVGSPLIEWDRTYSITFYNDSLNRISKETLPMYLFYPHYLDSTINKDILILYDNYFNTYSYQCRVTEGMGFNFIHTNLFENGEIKDMQFCVLNGDTIIDHITRIENNAEKISKIFLFPNPASNIVNLKGIKGNARLTFFDCANNIVQEKMIKAESLNDISTININCLTSGFYFVKVEFDNQIIVKKLIVNRYF